MVPAQIDNDGLVTCVLPANLSSVLIDAGNDVVVHVTVVVVGAGAIINATSHAMADLPIGGAVVVTVVYDNDTRVQFLNQSQFCDACFASVRAANGAAGGAGGAAGAAGAAGVGVGAGVCVKDCNGVWGGAAIRDDCGVCTGGTTKREFNLDQNCQGICFGPAVLDQAECLCSKTGETPCAESWPLVTKSSTRAVSTALSAVIYYQIVNLTLIIGTLGFAIGAALHQYHSRVRVRMIGGAVPIVEGADPSPPTPRHADYDHRAEVPPLAASPQRRLTRTPSDRLNTANPTDDASHDLLS